MQSSTKLAIKSLSLFCYFVGFGLSITSVYLGWNNVIAPLCNFSQVTILGAFILGTVGCIISGVDTLYIRNAIEDMKYEKENEEDSILKNLFTRIAVIIFNVITIIFILILNNFPLVKV